MTITLQHVSKYDNTNKNIQLHRLIFLQRG